MPSVGASALELVRDLIVANTTPAPVDGTNMFIGYRPSVENTGLVYWVLEGFQNPIPPQTMGSATVALDVTTVDVQVMGAPNEAQAARDECRRLRYMIAQMSKEYHSRGLRMLWAQPIGQVLPLGRDPMERTTYMCVFNCWTEPSYV